MGPCLWYLFSSPRPGDSQVTSPTQPAWGRGRELETAGPKADFWCYGFGGNVTSTSQKLPFQKAGQEPIPKPCMGLLWTCRHQESLPTCWRAGVTLRQGAAWQERVGQTGVPPNPGPPPQSGGSDNSRNPPPTLNVGLTLQRREQAQAVPSLSDQYQPECYLPSFSPIP